MTKLLQGKRCLITGASRGLGRAIAEAFATQGAHLILVARDRAALVQLQQTLHTSVDILALDLHHEADQVIAAIQQQGTLDILINNAAIQGPIGKLTQNDWRAWCDTVHMDLMTPVYLCQQLLPFMPIGSKILNISGGGATSPRPHFTAYATAKAALVRFTETLAQEYPDIDINCIAPGAMKGAMLEAVLQAGAKAAGEKDYWAAQHCMTTNEEAVAERAAALCVYLATHHGITGKLISARWDAWETLDQHREELMKSDVYTLRRIVPAERGMTW